jgi:outer membrane protein assembly factor BamA
MWGGVGLIALLGAIHLPLLQSRIVESALDRLPPMFGLTARIEQGSFNLLTLTVRASGLSLSTPEDLDTPFAKADRLLVTLSPAALLGRMEIERIEIDALQIDVLRNADGRLNLPSARASSESAAASRVPIGRVALRNAGVRYRDFTQAIEAGAAGISMTLEPDRQGSIMGRLVAGSPPRVRFGEVEVVGTRFDGGVRYDGGSLFFERFVVETREARLRVHGGLESLWSDPRLSSEVSGTVALSELSSTLSVDPAARGTVAVEATVTGPLASPIASVALGSDGLNWRHLGPVTLHSSVALSTSALDVNEARLSLDGGVVNLRAHLAHGDGAAQISAGWQSLPAASVLGPQAPIRLAARLTGEAELRGNLSGGWLGWEGKVENRSHEDSSRQPAVPLEGALTATFDGGHWKVEHRHRVAGGITLAGSSVGLPSPTLPASQVDGRAEITAADLSRATALFEALGVDLAPALRPQEGTFEAHLRMRGTLASPELIGEAAIAGLRFENAGPIEGRSKVVLNTSAVGVDGLQLSLAANRVAGSGTVRLGSRALRGGLTIAFADLAALGQSWPELWRPSGALTAELDLSGTTERPIVRGEIEGTHIAAAGQRLETVTALVSYERGFLTARQIRVHQPEGGELSGNASYAPSSGQYELGVRASAISLEPVGGDGEHWPIAATFHGHFDGRGTLASPSGEGGLSFAKLSWDATSIGRADVNVKLDGGRARLNGRLHDLSTDIAGSVRLRGQRAFELIVDARDSEISQVLSKTFDSASSHGAPEGRVSAMVVASGDLDDVASTTATVELRQIDFLLAEASLHLVNPVKARYSERTLEVDGLQLSSGASVFELSGAVGRARAQSSLRASLRGNLRDAQPWLAAFGLANRVTVEGKVAATVEARGSLDRPVLAGEIDITQGDVSIDDLHFTDLHVQAGLHEGAFVTKSATGRLADSTVTGSLDVPLRLLSEWLPDSIVADSASGEAALTVEVDRITPATLTHILGRPAGDAVEGHAAVVLDLRAAGLAIEQVSGSLALRDLQMKAAGVPVTQARPTRVILSDGRAFVADWVWDVAGNRLTVAGQASLGGNRELDLRAAGQVDLRIVQAFTPTTWTTGGTADVAVNIGGTLESPSLDGALELRRAELRSVDPQISLSGIEGRVVLEGQRLRIDGLHGSLNGGRFEATGEARHEQWTFVDGAISLKSTGIAMDVPAGLRTGLDAAVTLSFSRDRPRLAGSVTVQRGAYRQPLSLAAGFLAAARQRAFARPADRSAAFDQLQLDVAIVSEQDLIVDNNYGRMDLTLDLRLVGTLDRPSVVGRAAIRDGGVMYLGGRTYQIESGTIDFTNPRAIVPTLDITARTRIAGYDITLEIAGPPDSIRATLSSDPSLAQSDIVSLLTAGRLAEDVGGAGTQIAREQVLGYLSGEVLGVAGRAIGLDTLRFESTAAIDQTISDPSLIAGEADPASRLTISKRFSRYVEVVLSQNLQDEGRLTWIVSYTPRGNVELRGVSRDDFSRSYEARHNVTFGGSDDRASAGRRDAEAPDLRISAVRFSGKHPFPEPELRSRLGLGSGDRFDFYRWQRDRERIRRLLLDRGYLEARVGTRRVESAEAERAVALEYDIDAGPVARLRIEGHEFDGDFHRELETVWSNAVFDEALIADLEGSVRARLAGDGFLRPDVGVSMQGSVSQGEKQITITVAPGAHTAGREIRFEGNQEVSREALDRIVSALDDDVWLEPALLTRELLTLYGQLGHLAARVTAGPVEFAGVNATMSVRIDEGPRFVVSRVSAVEVFARQEADVLREFGIAPGSPYSEADLERGRRDLESAYAREGFTAARVTTDTDIDLANGRVAVTLTLDEGPKQVVDRVIVEPVPGVRPEMITETLNLEQGSPVNMEEWYTARRRLLETGLFRRVDIEAVPETDADMPAGVVEVEARVSLDRHPLWRLRYGLDISDEPAPASDRREFGGGFNADIQRRGLFGRAGTFGGAFRIDADQRIARTFLTFPSLFRRSVASSLYLSRSREHFDSGDFLAFITDKTEVTAEQRISLNQFTQLAYGYQFERNHTFDPDRDPDDPFGLDLTANAARLTSTATRETRDDPFDATRGIFHSSNFEYAPSLLGSDVRFVKYLLQQFAYARVAGRLVSASAIRVGVGRGFGQELLPSERFFAGGANTVRGFPDDSLGGFDALGAPRGGQAMIVLNQEARFPIYRWLRGVAFVDAGNVFPRASDLSHELAVGAGAGLRFATPFGLFRLDLGVPVVDRQTGTGARWHFAFGQMF